MPIQKAMLSTAGDKIVIQIGDNDDLIIRRTADKFSIFHHSKDRCPQEECGDAVYVSSLAGETAKETVNDDFAQHGMAVYRLNSDGIMEQISLKDFFLSSLGE